MPVMSRLNRAAWAIFVVNIVVPTVASAQVTAQFPLQFDFLTPGARSMALGSAFIGLADDATAAVANPAGLLTLTRPEISVEGRHRRVENPFLVGGRLSGNITNSGEDTVQGPIYDISEDSSFNLSYLSVVYPQPRWAVAFFTHQPTVISSEFLYRGVFESLTIFGVPTTVRENPLSGSRDISIRQYGGAFSARANSKLTFGVGVSAYAFQLDATFARLGLPGNTFGAPDPNAIEATATQTSEEMGIGFNAGIQFQPSSAVKIGAVYRKAPSFDYVQESIVRGRSPVTRTGAFKVPDSYGAGLSWRPSDATLLSVDYVFTKHSQIKEDFIDLLTDDAGVRSRLVIDDTHELHVGFEYVITGLSWTPALRAGLWSDPDHSTRYDSSLPGAPVNAFDDLRLRNMLRGGDDLFHYTAGLGVPVSSKFELSGAVDFSERSTLASISAIVRF
jgi:long-chain fatty acid transport protein